MPDSVQGTGHRTMNKTEEVPVLMKLTFEHREGRQKISTHMSAD